MVAIILILLAAVTCSLGAKIPSGLIPQQKGVRRIVGGRDAVIEDFPYMATLRHFETHRCGAAIITKKAVITAGHCVDGTMRNYLDVRVGATFRENDGIVMAVKRFSLHASYKKEVTIDYDIAIVTLQDVLTYSPKVQPIPFPGEREQIPIGSKGYVTGFGRTSEKGDVPTQLQAAQIPILKPETCKKVYGSGFTNRMICAGFTDGSKDACQQDSGGPFVVNGKLFGIVSWALGCAREGFPGVYTNVTYFSDWIDFTKDL